VLTNRRTPFITPILLMLLLPLVCAAGGFSGRQLQSATAPDERLLAKIAPQVLALTEGDREAEFFLVLADQADLRAADRLPTKAEKGRAVYRALWDLAQSAQRPLRSWLGARGIGYRSFYIVNALLIQGDRDLVLALAGRTDVARLEANPRVRGAPDQEMGCWLLVAGCAPFSSPMVPARRESGAGMLPGPASPGAIEANIAYVRAPEVWALGYTGQGVVVGGQDTGYQWDHPALKRQYRGWDGAAASHDYSWHDAIHTNTHGANSCGADSPLPCDDYGHGTHTMGTVLGDDGAGNQVGMAPGARWIGCRNMDNGYGAPATYLECLEFFLAPYPVLGTPAQGDPAKAPDITVNSWGCPSSEGCSWNTLQAAFEAQRAAGIMTVVSAGNAGAGGCGTVSDPPAVYASVYTVGALNTGADTLATLSSRGPVTVDGSNRLKPDIVAPGTGVRSSVPGGGYVWMTGTSMAGPHVAGAAALLLSAVPDLVGQVGATRDLLNANALHLASSACGGAGWPNALFGYGRLDALAAVLDAQHNATTTVTPTPTDTARPTLTPTATPTNTPTATPMNTTPTTEPAPPKAFLPLVMKAIPTPTPTGTPTTTATPGPTATYTSLPTAMHTHSRRNSDEYIQTNEHTNQYPYPDP